MKLTTTFEAGAGGRWRWHDKNAATGKVEAQCVQVGFRTEEDAVNHRLAYAEALQAMVRPGVGRSRPARWYRHPALLLVAFAAGVLVCYLVL